jgi:hypothetical protein
MNGATPDPGMPLPGLGRPPRSAEQGGLAPWVGSPESKPSYLPDQPPRPPGYDIANGGPFGHGACGRWWTGTSVGHCGRCHEEFSHGAFDAHQSIRGGVLACSTAKLVAHEMPYGTLWRLPGDESGAAHFAAKRSHR